MVVVAYALSPIDLIPDFIPVLGLLDDLILLPVGIQLALHLLPQPVLRDCQNKAQQAGPWKPQKSYIAAIAILLIWIILLAVVLGWLT